jgi:hypothetical protein
MNDRRPGRSGLQSSELSLRSWDVPARIDELARPLAA